jgi:hypothetical protein
MAALHFANLSTGFGQSAGAPVMTGPTTAIAQYGQSFAYWISGTNSPSSYTATGLPPGVTFSGGPGVITGTPSQVGTFNATVTATNSYGTATQPLTITVSQPTGWAVVPAITTNIPINATSDPAGNTYSFTAGALVKTTPGGVSTTIATAHVYQESSAITVDDFAFTSVVVDPSGNVYAAETNNGLGANPDPGELILEVGTTGTVTTTPVNISENPNLANANCQITVDSLGDVFTIAPDFSIREILPGGQDILIASQSNFDAPDDQNAYPSGISQNGGVLFTSGYIYDTDYAGPIEILALGPSTTLSFTPYATAEQLGGSILGVAADASGNVYATIQVGNVGNAGYEVVGISPTGAITTTPVATTVPTPAQPYVQVGGRNAVDAAGNTYSIVPAGNLAVDPSQGGGITKTTPAGVTTTILPFTTSIYSPDGGTTQTTLTFGYVSVAVDAEGNVFAEQDFLFATPGLFLLDGMEAPVYYQDYSNLIELSSSGVMSTITQSDPPYVLAADGSTMYGAQGSFLCLIPMPPTITGLHLPTDDYSQADFISSMAFDSSGRMYVLVGGAIYVAPTRPFSPAPEIIFQPQGATILFGSSTTLSVTAVADPGPYPITYQWYLDGTAISGATSPSYPASQPGSYTVEATNPSGSQTSAPADVITVTSSGAPVAAPPTLVTQPSDAGLTYGGSAALSVAALSTLPLSYQWQLDGVDIPGATQANFTAGDPGFYDVVITTTGGSVTSQSAEVSLENRLADISSRADIGSGSAVGIAGFVLDTNPGLTKQVLIRAVGPSLSKFGLTGLLANPVLSVFNSAGDLIASNAGWNVYRLFSIVFSC